MKEFRQALDAYLAGQIDLAALQRALAASLAQEPNLAATLGAYLEALYRGNRIAGEAYLALVQLTRAQADADKTRFRAPRAAPAPQPAAAPAPGAAAVPDHAAAPGAAAADGDKTVFRVPKSASAAPAEAAPPPRGRPRRLRRPQRPPMRRDCVPGPCPERARLPCRRARPFQRGVTRRGPRRPARRGRTRAP
jgi:hypothetical protein